jgi:hypothetical protein
MSDPYLDKTFLFKEFQCWLNCTTELGFNLLVSKYS